MIALAVLEIAVLTMTPGSDAFARFGHTALRVQDPSGIHVYNFGAFKGDDPHIASQFLHNQIPYYLTKNELDLFAWKYRDRTITAQVLALDEPEARRLIDKLEWTARPENRNYQYEWFHVNCTTKTRDVIDEAIGGVWRAQLAGKPARVHSTVRSMMMDALWSVPSMATLLSISINARGEEPLDGWQELGMPADLMRGLAEARRPDGRPLVADTWSWEGPVARPRNQPTWLQPLAEALLLYLLMMGAFGSGRLARGLGRAGLYLWAGLSVLLASWFLFWTILPYGYGDWTVNLLGYSPLAVMFFTRHARRFLAIVFLSTAIELALHLSKQVHLRYALYALAANGLGWLVIRAEAAARREPRSA